MKNPVPPLMFPSDIYLVILIVKRIAQKLVPPATCVALAALQLSIPVTAQMSVNDARNLREHIYKGNSFMGRRDFQGALDEYEQALEIEPGNGTAKDNIVLTHNNWGIDLFRQKKYDEAREQWNMALKLNPYDRNAKNNLAVLKATLIKLGPSASPALPPQSGESDKEQTASDGEPKSGPSVMPKGSRAAKEDNTPVPNAVVIGHPAPGGNSSTGTDSFSSGASIITTGSGSGGSGGSSSGGVVILNSGARQAASPPPPTQTPTITASPPPTAVPPAPPMNPYANTTSQAQPLSEQTKPGAATNIYSSSTSSSNSLGLANLEDKLSALETKVYGHSTRDTPILQRLERIERDTSSRPSLGSINDRVQTLLKTYGL